MARSLRTKRTIFSLIFAFGLALPFQNCSRVQQTGQDSNSQRKEGGTGIDGKSFQNYAVCGSHVDIANVIVVNQDKAMMVRQDCVDLPSAQEVSLSDVLFPQNDSTVFKFKDKVFNQKVVSGPQPVTVAFCQAKDSPPSAQALVWQFSGQPGVLFGRVNRADGVESGPLVVQASGPHYQSADGQPSHIDLDVASGTLTYSFISGPQVSLFDLDCGTQSDAPAATSTGLSAPAGYASSPLLFEDHFSATSLDSSKWIAQIADQNGIWRKDVPAPYSATDAGGNDAEFYDPERAISSNGLSLVATRDTTFAGYSWRSGVLTTHGKFSFAGGYAQFRAKMPDSSSGMWGNIFFMEGGSLVTLQGSGYLGANPNRMMLSAVLNGSPQSLTDTGKDLSNDYHVYGMEYRPGISIKMYLDGMLMATYTNNIPTGAFTIALSLQVAQNASSWHTGVTASTPSPSVFAVSDVQVYQLVP